MAVRADVAIDFDIESEYNDNFTELRFVAQNSWNAQSGNTAPVNAQFGAYVKTVTSATTTLMRYDTNQGDGGAKGPTDILDQTIEMDYWTDALRTNDGATPNASPNFGIVTRIQSNDTGILALASFLGTTSVQLRLYHGGVFNAGLNGPGTLFYDATFNLADGSVANGVGTGGIGSTNALTVSNHNFTTSLWNSINPYHISLEQTSGDDPSFNLTIADAQGLVASTGDVIFTVNDNYNTAGAVGLRIGNNGGTIRTGFDNFAITSVPEPAALALTGLGSLLIVSRRRSA